MSKLIKILLLITTVFTVAMSCGKAPLNTSPPESNQFNNDQALTTDAIELKISDYSDSNIHSIKVEQAAWLTIPKEIFTTNLTEHSFTARIHLNSKQSDISNEHSMSAYCEYKTTRQENGKLDQEFLGCFQRNELLAEEGLGFDPGDIIAQDLDHYIHFEIIQTQGTATDMFTLLNANWI